MKPAPKQPAPAAPGPRGSGVRPEFVTHLRALLIALGLYATGALVWFVGPLVQVGGVAPLASERARIVAIAGVLLLFVLHVAWRALSAARRNRRLLDGLLPAAAARPSEAAAPGAPEVAVIGQRFTQALQVLRSRQVGPKSAFGWLRRRPYVYQLPWYIIIGAPGAGKTTTIVNSGLQFPFAGELGPKALRGAGGTRNCDWWFTSDAVLIDTAGRYTTQDSYREADRAAWLGFLQLLVRHRPRQPINGVILTLSATDLLQPDADKRRVLAREMRERISELHAQLGIRFPIYVMVTKCDLLAGFAEFFADFDKDERGQVWGATLPLGAKARAPVAAAAAKAAEPAAPTDADTASRLARLSGEMVALEKSLHECLMARLHDERDRDRRAALFGFPQQWRMLRDALNEMLRMTFESSSGPAPLLRGVYFTSATQEGSPMDRALGALSRALGLAHRVLPPGRPSGRSYFVTRLLREVVLGEAGLAGTNRRWERQRAWLHGGVVAASVLLTVAALGWAWRQYAGNTEWLATARPAVALLQTQASQAKGAAPGAELSTMVPLLDGLWSLARDSDARGGRRAASLGLDQSSNLAAAAQDAYHHVLRDSLVPRLAKRLEQRLDASGADALFARYEALKAYLMLFGGTHFDAAALRSYLLADWDSNAAQVGSAAARKALREHLDRLLATGEVGAPAMADANLVARTRQQLSTAAPAQRVLARLRQVDATQGSVPLSIESAALATANKVLTRASGAPLESGVAPLYTRAAQQALRARLQASVGQLEEEAPWVLGAPAGTTDAAARTRLIEGIESQLAVERLRAWDALVFDLRLLPVSSLAAAAEQARLMSRPDSPLNSWLTALLRDMGPTAGPEANETLSAEADRLQALRAYAMGSPAGYEPVHAAAGRIAAQLAAVDDAVARKAAAPAADAWSELAGASARVPEPLRTLWQQMAETDATLAFTALRELWGQQLAGEVAPACARAVDGRYPFMRQGTQEISREEFQRTFASGGTIDGFFQRHLAGWVDTSTRPWSVRTVQAKWGDALLPFQRAQAIRSAFFGDGGRQFGVRMDLRLLELDPGIGQLIIDVDGQALRFSRDHRSVQTLQWPGPGGAGRIQLQASAPGASGGARFSFEGPWSLLRLFERVRIEPAAAPGRVVLVFDVEGRRARLEAHNPQGPLAIVMPELEQFQCPRRL